MFGTRGDRDFHRDDCLLTRQQDIDSAPGLFAGGFDLDAKAKVVTNGFNQLLDIPVLCLNSP